MFLWKMVKKSWRGVKRWFAIRREHRITLEGILFVVITFFIGFAAINTSTNLLYLIMSMMLALFILSGILSTNTLRKIELRRLVARHISALENANVQIEIKNGKKRLSSYSLRIMDYLESGDLVGVSYLFHIGPRSHKNISYTVRFPKRGLYRLSRLKIVTRFPFGFFERAFILRQPQEILVYPRIIDVRPVLEGANVDLGEYETGRKGHGHSLYGLREYVPRDSARFIHWKVSARTSKLMVREFEKEEKKKVTLYINNSIRGAAGPSLSDMFEKAVIYTASTAKYLIDREFQVQLATGDGKVPFGTGIAHLYRILRALAVIQLEPREEHVPSLPPMDADSTNVIFHFDQPHHVPYPTGFAHVIDVSKLKNIPTDS